MLQTIMLYLTILVVGALIGRFVKLSHKASNVVGKAQFLCLLLLLFLMGANLGLNDEVLKNVGKIGVDASIFSIFTIVFSVFGISIYRRLFMKEVGKFLGKEETDGS